MTLHCSQCGKPLAPARIDGRERPQCPACGFILYRNPAPVGLAVIEHAGQLVLIRRAAPPLAGYLAPPAGYVETGESVAEATVREVREETGLAIALDGLFEVYSHADVNVVIIAYRAHVVAGVPQAGDDALEVGLFEPGAWPQEPLPQSGAAIDEWFYGVIHDVLARWRPTQPKGSQ